MALHACLSVAAAELGRPPPPPAPTTAGHFTSAHTRSRPPAAWDAGATWSAARLGRDAAPLTARFGSLRQPLPCPPGAPPPSSLASRPASVAPTFVQPVKAPSQLHARPGTVPGESGWSGNRPPNCSLSSLPSLAPALQSPPHPRPPPDLLGPPPAPQLPPSALALRARQASAPGKRLGGGGTAAAEAARSTIVFLTLWAPTLRLFPFLPPPPAFPPPPPPPLAALALPDWLPADRRAPFWRAGSCCYRQSASRLRPPRAPAPVARCSRWVSLCSCWVRCCRQEPWPRRVPGRTTGGALAIFKYKLSFSRPPLTPKFYKWTLM